MVYHQVILWLLAYNDVKFSLLLYACTCHSYTIMCHSLKCCLPMSFFSRRVVGHGGERTDIEKRLSKQYQGIPDPTSNVPFAASMQVT